MSSNVDYSILNFIFPDIFLTISKFIYKNIVQYSWTKISLVRLADLFKFCNNVAWNTAQTKFYS